MPVVSEQSQPILSDAISSQPLVKLSKAIATPTDINPPAIAVTPIAESSVNSIQRRVEPNFNLPVVQVNSEQLSPATEFIKSD